MTQQLPDWLAHRAFVRPAHTALASAAGDLTYRQLDQRVAALAATLAARGVGSGDRVAVIADNSAAFVELVHAAARAGVVLVPLNPRLTVPELRWQVEHVRPRLLVAPQQLSALAADAAGETPMALHDDLHREGGGQAFRAHDASDPAMILFTSGTTGRPRGVILTYGNFWASATGSAFNMGVAPDDRWLAFMPLFHVGGLSILVRSVIYGTTVVLHDRFDEHAANAAIREQGVTLFSAVATMLERMLNADDASYPPSLRVALIGGGPVPRPLLERAVARGVPVLQTYGLTEATSQVSTLAPADAVAHLGSAGKPLLGTEVEIDAQPGEPGEIRVRGGSITPGYLDDPVSTTARIRDGWLHTGDIGRLDEDGYLYVVDRRDDLIVSGGENISPAEVEEALTAHAAIREAAVVGLPDPRWGHRVAAAIVADAGLDDAAIESWLRPRLAGYKLPRSIYRFDELPRTASGKIQRHRVRAQVQDLAGA